MPLSHLNEIAVDLSQGYSYEEIAARHGLTKGQVSTRTRALRQFLAERANDYGWVRRANQVQVGRAFIGETVLDPTLKTVDG